MTAGSAFRNWKFQCTLPDGQTLTEVYMIELRNWTLCASGDEFTPPECRSLIAGGEIDHHPVLGPCNGKKIVTTPIRVASGNKVQTRNSTYVLVGPPCEHFTESVLQKHGLTFDGDIGPIVTYLNGG